MRLRADQKLFLTYLAVIAAVVVALTLGVGATLRRHLTALAVGDLRRELEMAEPLRASRPHLPRDSVADWLGGLSGRRVTIVDRAGRVLGDSELDGPALAGMESHLERPEVREALAGRVGSDVRRSQSVREEHVYLAAPSLDREVLRLSFPLRDMTSAVTRVQRGIFSVGLIALLVTGLLSFGFSRAVTRPLRQLAAVARAMAGGDLSRRARVRRPDELGELGDALDKLSAELQRRLGQLEGERAEMQALIDAMAEGVVAIGPDGRVQRTNPAARRIFSLAGDPRGVTPDQVTRRREFLELVRQSLGGAPVVPTELAQGDRQLLATAQPLPGGGAVMVFLDVTELRRLEDVRRDFVANASHELKTPLTVVRGFSETLLDDDLPPALRRQFAETVRANADRLQRIIDDLLDLSRIESGGWRPDPQVVSVREVARDAWAALGGGRTPPEARFEIDVPPECEFVRADPSALAQVFANLLGNAVRYVPAGGRVQVVARPAGSPALPPSRDAAAGPAALPPAEDGGWIVVEVRDDGSGIPAAHLPRIFERFYRADTARSRAEGGTGLGLSIVRHLVERHGGGIEAESRLGEGTTIRFTLPAPDADHPDDADHRDEVRHGDDPDDGGPNGREGEKEQGG